MEREGHYFKVGLFILLALGGILAFFTWAKTNGDADHSRRYLLYFNESVNGLNKGGAIKYRGVQVGQIEKIAIDPKISTRIVVTAVISNQAPVHQGTVAMLKYQGLTGTIYVELNNQREQAPALETAEDELYPVIPTVPSDLQRVVDKTADMVSKLSEIADKAKLLFTDENIAAFNTSMMNLRKTTDVLAKNDERINKMLEDSSRAMQSLAELSAQISTLTREASPGIKQFSTDGLRQTNRLISESRETVRDIGDLSKELKDNPSQILFPPQHKGRPVE